LKVNVDTLTLTATPIPRTWKFYVMNEWIQTPHPHSDTPV
jgi:hypothetical protein